MSGTFDALTEILTSSKPTSANKPSSIWADSTSASGVAPPYFLYSRGSSEPALTPMRTGIPRSLHSRATSLISSGLRRLPGLSRRQSTPASRAARAISTWKWMSATIGTGLRGTIRARPSAASRSLQVQRTMSAPAAFRA